jgi:predicted Ser/Thr protein kinase
MVSEIIKELRGHSGSKIFLMKDEYCNNYIRKDHNIDRNYERLIALKGQINLPEIYNKTDNSLTMEYIHGLDMKTYLVTNDINPLSNFLTQ